MSQAVKAPETPGTTDASGRVTLSFRHRLMARPEVGAFIAAVVIYIFFFIVAPTFRTAAALSLVLGQSATVGIVAVAVGLLMVGGEFDLSAGVGAFTAGLCAAMLSYQYSLNMWVGAIVSLVLLLAIGFINGYLVVKTGIPSFLVTLGHVLRAPGRQPGCDEAGHRFGGHARTCDIDGFQHAERFFASPFVIGSVQISILILWWLLAMAIAAWILDRTQIGNWIFAVGGNPASARAVGVPVNKVKIGLFMGVGFLAWFYGHAPAVRVQRLIQAGGGVGQRVHLHHRRGRRWHPADRRLRLGDRHRDRRVHLRHDARRASCTPAGIPNWFKAFLGVMLLLAVAVNLYVDEARHHPERPEHHDRHLERTRAIRPCTRVSH